MIHMRLRTTTLGMATALVCVSAGASAQNQRTNRDGNYQVEQNAFQWGGELAAGARIIVRSVNGSVAVEPARARTLEISASKKWRRGDPAQVRIEVTRVNGGRDILLCATWTPKTTCSEDEYNTSGSWPRNQDTQVDFTIRLPTGSNASLNVTNGSIEVTGASGSIEARTTNGEITAETTGGPVEARTTNGSINVRMAKLPTQGASYHTTNGTITLTLPDGTDADLQARTTNGSVISDFDITMSGTLSRRNLSGRIGRGGPRLDVATTNGNIRIERK
jgi:hypothetical protein